MFVGTRGSSIELFSIILMLCIVGHHYAMNSGLIDVKTQENALTSRSLFRQLFGWGGKTGINCFILNTYYYMCQSQANTRKF
jgi:hypothetical protein